MVTEKSIHHPTSYHLRLEREQLERWKKTAAEQGVTLKKLICDAVEAHIGELRETPAGSRRDAED